MVKVKVKGKFLIGQNVRVPKLYKFTNLFQVSIYFITTSVLKTSKIKV